MRFALIGLGRIGQVHAHNLSICTRAQLAGVFDTDQSRVGDVVDRYGCRSFESFEAVLRDDGIHAVLLASPTSLHADQVLAAASAGKAILCEKPLSLDLNTAWRTRDFVLSRKAHFMIALNKRFDPSISQLRTRLRDGEIGRIEALTLIGKDPLPPPEDYIKVSGGLYRDMMIHDIDLAVFLAGEYPAEAWAAGSVMISDAFARAKDHDTASAILRMPSGVIVTHTLSRRSPVGFDQRVEVHGEKGTLRTTNLHADLTEALTATGVCKSKLSEFFLQRYSAAYAMELEYFIDTLQGHPNDLDVHHAVAVQAIADTVTAAAMKSGLEIKYA